jgi:hypothetical protein
MSNTGGVKRKTSFERPGRSSIALRRLTRGDPHALGRPADPDVCRT